MKRTLLLTGLILFSPILRASPAMDCYKTVMTSPDLLVGLKKLYSGKNNWYFEARATELCGGAVTAEAPIQCFKDAMNDPEVLKDFKVHYGSYAYKIEDQIVGLCRSAR